MNSRNPYSDNDNHGPDWSKESPHVPYRGGVVHLPGQTSPVWEHEPNPQNVGIPSEDENIEIVETYAEQVEKTEAVPDWSNPVPVTVVKLPRRAERNEARFSGHYVENRPARVLGANQRRFRVFLRNVDESTVYIGHDNAVNTVTGFPLQTGAEIEVSTQGDVYAITASGESGNIGIIQEIGMDLDGESEM